MLGGGVNICSFTMETTMQSLHIMNVDSFYPYSKCQRIDLPHLVSTETLFPLTRQFYLVTVRGLVANGIPGRQKCTMNRCTLFQTPNLFWLNIKAYDLIMITRSTYHEESDDWNGSLLTATRSICSRYNAYLKWKILWIYCPLFFFLFQKSNTHGNVNEKWYLKFSMYFFFFFFLKEILENIFINRVSI